MTGLDDTLVLALHDWARSEPMRLAVQLLAEQGLWLLLALLPVVWLWPVRRRRSRPKQLAVLAALLAAALAFALGHTLEQLLARPRPFVALGLVPLFDHAADTSFPSEHTLVGVALALALGRVLGRWGLLPLLWALLIGVARIAAAVHYPSDILGSALLAVPLAALSWWIVDQLARWRGLLPPRERPLTLRL